ncbi:MAG: Multidrug resistance protein MdtA [Candidatus Erwinia impunctatus]|nr:Multidrug resistance protein MdtA [Culicoides impunctatus]
MNARSRFSKSLLVLVAAGCAAGGWFAWQTRHSVATNDTNATSQQLPGPHGGRRGGSGMLSPVQVAQVDTRDVPQYLNGLGTITAANTVTVRSRIDGQLMAIHFTEGQQVSAGDLLAEIDPRPYQVAVQQAEGQLAKDRATLANARRDLARYSQLEKNKLVSQQEMDTQRALVSETEGTLKVDEANVASAQLNLTYTRVTAPIAGRIGLKQVDVGNYITSSDTTGLLVITQTHPVDLLFTLPENNIATLQTARKSNDTLTVEAWNRDNSALLASGSLISIDNQIDTTTGTIKVKARFDNQDDSLFPNQFVNARLKVNTLNNARVIPVSALQMDSDGHFVWAVNDENKVSKKRVTAGIQYQREVVITAGVDVGTKVVTDGIDRLTEGAKVEIIVPQATPDVTPTIKATGAKR